MNCMPQIILSVIADFRYILQAKVVLDFVAK